VSQCHVIGVPASHGCPRGYCGPQYTSHEQTPSGYTQLAAVAHIESCGTAENDPGQLGPGDGVGQPFVAGGVIVHPDGSQRAIVSQSIRMSLPYSHSSPAVLHDCPAEGADAGQPGTRPPPSLDPPSPVAPSPAPPSGTAVNVPPHAPATAKNAAMTDAKATDVRIMRHA
jgi:hypothetical protein